MTLIELPRAAKGSGPDGPSVAGDLARETLRTSSAVRGDHEAGPRPGRTTRPLQSVAAPSRPGDGRPVTALFERLAKELGVDYTPAPRAEVRRTTTVDTDCPNCHVPTDLMHTDTMTWVRRHWFRCTRCRRWWALTITFRSMNHGPHETPARYGGDV